MPDNAPTTAVDPLPEIQQDIFCQRCGYNLRGLTGNRCPECGGSLDGVRSLVPQIPWMYRKELGWWHAYWRTIWFVMFRQRQFAEEMARPVYYPDSQFFRWLTIALAYLPVLVANFSLMVLHMSNNKFLHAVRTDWRIGLSLQLTYVLFLAAATGVPTYFFHPRAVPVPQQNRAIALSYYVCAPLVFLALPIAFGFGALQIMDSPADSVGIWLERRGIGLLCYLLAVLLGVGVLGAWWLGLNHLARQVLPQSRHRSSVVAVAVPLLWIVLFGGIVVGLPVAVYYLVLFAAVLIGSLL